MQQNTKKIKIESIRVSMI